MLKLNLCIFLIISAWSLCSAVQILQHLGYFVVVRQLECVVNEKYLTQASCNVIPPRNRSIDAKLMLMEKIKTITATLKVSIPNPKKKIFQKIFDITFELCKTLRERKRQALIDILSSMTRIGNGTLKCPLNEGFYQAHNITLVESLPPVLTESDFMVHFNWFIPGIAPVMNITVMGRLYDVGKENNRKRKYL